MKLFIPDNIFASIFTSTFPSESNVEVVKKESALLCKQLETDTSAVALIPSLDLINHQTLFVSSKIGISFDGILSNAYMYFAEKEKKIDKIKVRGDVSINEIVLTKILFSERFSSNVEISLDAKQENSFAGDYIIIGNENFRLGNYKKGISFSDQIAEMLDLPYVNYVFVSQDKESLEQFNSLLSKADEKIDNEIENILSNLNYEEEVKDFIRNGLGSVYFELTRNEIDAIKELIKLVYYHGIVDDIFDIKFL